MIEKNRFFLWVKFINYPQLPALPATGSQIMTHKLVGLIFGMREEGVRPKSEEDAA